MAALVLLLLWRYAYHSQLLVYDAQSSRSLHQGKTLTAAGILMFVPWCLMGVFVAPWFLHFYLVLALSVLGFVDDRYDLSFKLRLLVQLLAAVATLYAAGMVTPLWLQVFLIFCLLWWVNLFNFMDGANGMAGLHGVVSLSFYGFIFLNSSNLNSFYAFVALSCVLVLVVYLHFNLWLKKLFMGDSGSLPLAWVIAVMALCAIQTDSLSYVQVASIHAVFIVDASMTLLLRWRRGENITQAHASHLYQRLVKTGRSHPQVSGGYAALTVVLCLLVWLTLHSTWLVQWTVLALVYVFLLAVFMKFLNLGR